MSDQKHIRRVRQIAQARSIIARRRRKQAKNAIWFERPQTFLVVGFPDSGPLRIESIQKHSFAGARKHAGRCVGEGVSIKLFWLSAHDARKAMRNLADAKGVEIAL